MGQIHITIDDKYKLAYKSLDPNSKKELQVAVRTITREFFDRISSPKSESTSAILSEVTFSEVPKIKEEEKSVPIQGRML
jgi:hypothetical protein